MAQNTPRSCRSITHNRAVGLKLLCAMALGVVAVGHAQPFPSFLLDTTVVVGPDPAEADWTSVAFGSQRGFVVWTDGDLVKGCRFTRELAPLDTPGLPLSRVNSYYVSDVDVASSRDMFLAVWSAGAGYGPVIAGALVAEADTAVMRVTLDSSDMCHSVPVVAANDSGFLVAWSEYDSASGSADRTRYARVSRSGVVLDTATRLVAEHRGMQYRPDAVWGDTSYLVVWLGWSSGDTGIFCNIIRADGTRASDDGYLITREFSTGAPVVTYDGRSFIVMWDRLANKSFAPEDELRVVRVSSEGVITDSARVTVDQGETDYRWHGLASIRDTTLLVWESWRDSAWWAFGVRLDSVLHTLDSVPLALAPPVGGDIYDAYAPAGISCATVGDTFVVSWAGWIGPKNFHTPGRDVFCRRVTTEGLLPDTAAVMMSHASSFQNLPAVASDGSDFLAVWQELRADSTLYDSRLYYTRFSHSGALLDSAPTFLRERDVIWPFMCYGGGYYMVAWGDGFHGATPRVLAVRIEPDGTLVDTVPIVVASGQKYQFKSADIGYVDSTFLIATQANYPDWCIYGSRISCDGEVLDTVPFEFPPGEEGPRRYYPGVASDGDSTFIVTRFYPSGTQKASFVRCTSGGVMLDSTEVILGDVLGTFNEVYVSPVRGPGEYFVVATTSVGPSAAWRVSYTGTVLDTIEDVYPFFPGTRAVYDGVNYVVTNAHGEQFAIGIGAQMVKPDGTVINNPPILVVGLDTTRSRYSSRFVRPATNEDGITAVVFTTYEQVRYGSRRVRAAVWAPLAVGEAGITPSKQAFSIRPNPVTGAAVLELGSRVVGPIRVSLYDVQGRLTRLLTGVPAGVRLARIPVDLSGVPAGVYFVDVQPTGTRTKLVVLAK